VVRVLFLAVLVGVAFPGGAWELTVAFTNDLHASLESLAALEPFLRSADLVLDAGDTWEDLYRFTDVLAAEETLGWMKKIGYDGKVLGNHDAYLGPSLPGLISRADFPVVVTNMHGMPGVVPWALVERGELRILILGFLGPEPGVFFPYPLWPKVTLLDPATAARKALEAAPEHDLLIVLAHMELADAAVLARAVPECDLLVLGHDHLFLEEPVWAGKVPIVQAGHRAQAVGLATLGPGGLVDYELIHTGETSKASPISLLPVVLLGFLFFFLSSARE
jgi:2',3'-cyclic-nucleotide 2'-phosphodiesterase (5'-nucleotidase family)